MYTIKTYTELDETVLEELCSIQPKIFENPYTRVQIFDRIKDTNSFLSVHAYLGTDIVGFKSGYALDPTTFYSWIGGVHPSHRRRGVAQMLMQKQHDLLRKQGFLLVETKTQNKFREMLVTNLKSGFDITRTFTEADRGLQIVLQRRV